MRQYFLFLMFLFSSIFTSAQVKVIKDLAYADGGEKFTLNIYQPKDTITPKDVIVFVHGGSWSSGKKETYWWLGRNFARKGVVVVNVNYPLAPEVGYQDMAKAVAKAIDWTAKNIAEYGGNNKRIFLMGHSAGAHLIELVNADPQYFKAIGAINPAKAIILNDPFGLDMYQYLTTAEKDHYYYDFIRTFTTNETNWKLGSPLNYSDNITKPHLLFYGEKTYGAIQIQTPVLYQLLKDKGIKVELHQIKKKKHVGMIAQMIFGNNSLYQTILGFISSVK